MRKKKATPRKKAAAKKQPPASKRVEIKIDLGLGAKPKRAQLRRLKDLVQNDVLTWVKSDLQNEFAPPIVTEEQWICVHDGDDEE